ncbi:lipoprotein [Streptomyces sulfonofaciens]|uniref:Lipoprotein n=1 Tax=Streptomyces sulfonofaciens TaxID=68272 RepID=A0A919GAN3_9ACTN|nr:hypothetical protein [Streptomyces sulfonofaciens]GHH81035.1 lipoprotein [Streptomyces sulfonofaciens]
MRFPSRAHPRPPASTGGPTRTAAGFVLACATAAVLTGCSAQDAICGDGEYPVMSAGGTGSACAPDGKEPPDGYVRYPQGKVPQHVGDRWDTYWNTHTVDENGNIVKVSRAG